MKEIDEIRTLYKQIESNHRRIEFISNQLVADVIKQDKLEEVMENKTPIKTIIDFVDSQKEITKDSILNLLRDTLYFEKVYEESTYDAGYNDGYKLGYKEGVKDTINTSTKDIEKDLYKEFNIIKNSFEKIRYVLKLKTDIELNIDDL